MLEIKNQTINKDHIVNDITQEDLDNELNEYLEYDLEPGEYVSLSTQIRDTKEK